MNLIVGDLITNLIQLALSDSVIIIFGIDFY